MLETDLIRCLRVIALTNQERMALVKMRKSPEIDWVLEHVDELVPELHRRGWIAHREFDHEAGAVVVTTGQGDVQIVVATELGLAQLNAAVA